MPEAQISQSTFSRILDASTMLDDGVIPITPSSSGVVGQVGTGPTSEINTVTSNAVPATAGTFTLTVNLQVATIAFDATAAAVQAALEALSGVGQGAVSCAGSGGGTDLGDASHVVTITWAGRLAGRNIAIIIGTGGLTGNAHVLATTQAGVGLNRVVDLGAGQVSGEMIVDLMAIDVGTGNEVYYLILMGSDNSSFTSGVRPLAVLLLGDSSLTLAGADSTIGRYVIPFRNCPYRPLAPSAPLTPSRYVRSVVQGFGTIAPTSFDYLAYLSIDLE